MSWSVPSFLEGFVPLVLFEVGRTGRCDTKVLRQPSSPQVKLSSSDSALWRTVFEIAVVSTTSAMPQFRCFLYYTPSVVGNIVERQYFQMLTALGASCVASPRKSVRTASQATMQRLLTCVGAAKQAASIPFPFFSRTPFPPQSSTQYSVLRECTLSTASSRRLPFAVVALQCSKGSPTQFVRNRSQVERVAWAAYFG